MRGPWTIAKNSNAKSRDTPIAKVNVRKINQIVKDIAKNIVAKIVVAKTNVIKVGIPYDILQIFFYL